jgi:RimJ/RimL family protein N-acetyltransferase
MTAPPDPLRAEEVALRDGRHVVVRPATFEDAPALARNVNLVSAEEIYIMFEGTEDLEGERTWLAAFDGIRNVLFVADDRGEVVGAADCHGGSFDKDRHVGGIGIAIRDGFREVGLGRILMLRVLEWMKARSFEKAELALFATNTRAQRLYESLGFRVEGVKKDHVRIRGSCVDEVWMGLWLGPASGVTKPSRSG